MNKLMFLTLVGMAIFFAALLSAGVKAQGVSEKAFDPGDRGPFGRITFIHYRNGQTVAKTAAGKGGGKESCYSYIAGGAKWKAPKDYIINPTNSNLDNLFVQQVVDSSVAEWEKYGGGSIFGVGSLDPAFPIIGFNNDQKNVVSFGSWDDDSAIAVTTVWGYFAGSPKLREITEWDILFNTYYLWGDALLNGSTVMDLQNIATHELGHSAGMGDVYSGTCLAETMYGYSFYGEVSDRTLNTGDIQGISKLYR